MPTRKWHTFTRRRARRGIAAAIGALALGTSASGGEYGRALFQWSDSLGVVRFTTYPERVPREHQHTLQRIEGGRSAEQNAELLPGARTGGAGTRAGTADTADAGLPGDPAAGVAASGTGEPSGPPAGEARAAELPRDDLGGREGALPGAAAKTTPLDALDRRIAELEREIERDEETIKTLLSDPESASGLETSGSLSELARRLPSLLSELEALRAERARRSRHGG